MRRAQFTVGGAALLGALPSRTPAQTASRPLNVGTIPFDPGAQAYYAQDRGIFQAVGLTVHVMPMTSGGAITAGVVSGTLDVGFSNVFSVIAAHARGIGVVVIAPATLRIAGTPILALCVPLDAPYRTAKELNGKTLAVDSLQGLTQLVTEAWFDKNGGDSRSLKFVEMPEPTISAAIQQGRVDAGTLQVTNVDLTAHAPLRSIADPYDAIAPRFVPAVWITTREWLGAHPAEAQRFAEAMRRTARWANANRAASATILMRIAKLTPERMAALSTHRVLYGETLDPRLMQPLIDVAARYGVIRSAFPAHDLLPPAA